MGRRQYERCLEELERRLADGQIDQAEYNAELRELERDERDEQRERAEEAARDAYERTMEQW